MGCHPTAVVIMRVHKFVFRKCVIPVLCVKIGKGT